MPFGSEQWMYASGGFYPYEIDQSLRFNDDDSAYLNRTPASAGNRKTFTFSFWAKPVSSTYDPFFGSRGSPTVTRFEIGFYLGQIFIQNNNGSSWNLDIKSSALFRDFSAWYHIVLVFDTTQATASDRVKLYVNGVDQSLAITTSPSLNLDLDCMTTTATSYVGHDGGGSNYYDGYMADYYFIDGQALDATSFGEFKSGVWIPKSYSGSYGTNGFYLDFGNSGSLGADSSGNGNNWTPNNLAATDQVPDSPTNNFATLNPLNARLPSTALSEGNLKWVKSTVSDFAIAYGSMGISSGKHYFEVDVSAYAVFFSLGVYDGSAGPNTDNDSNSAYYSLHSGTLRRRVDGGTTTTIVSGVSTSTGTIGLAVDADAGEVSFYHNNTLQGTVTGLNTDVTYFPRITVDGSSNSSTVYFNFGQDSSFAGNKTAQGNTDANGIGDFYYSPPAGYLALCTANLPEPAIDPAQDDVPEDYFNTVLYTATGNDNLAITGVGFQPDFTWIKSRSAAYSHNVYDAVRGVSKRLQTNLTNAESSPISGVKSFDADGFTLGNDTNDTNFTSGVTYVAWHWLAGNGTTSNTDGTITSTVSANQKAGFSIVSYATGGLPNATVGHGLAQSPEMIIAKQRDVADIWLALTDRIDGSLDYLALNTTAAKTDYDSGAFTSSTFTNPYALSSDVIAYCFHSVEGYSKIGSYTGNGSADGPFVYTGFRPAFVICKRTNSSGQWGLLDNERPSYNVTQKILFPNGPDAEVDSSSYAVDFVSNGFKLRNTGAEFNQNNGDTYIYMAFAEMPTKYSNAR